MTTKTRQYTKQNNTQNKHNTNKTHTMGNTSKTQNIYIYIIRIQ